MLAVYKIVNVVNQHFYVGSSVKIRTRFQTHRRQLRKGTHHCVALQRAWSKYGEDCFKFTVIASPETIEAMVSLKDQWLIEHQGKPHCYNTGTRAGAAFQGKKHTEKSKAKMAEASKGNRFRLGQTNSLEHRQRQSQSMRGIKKSPKHVEKIRQRMIGTSYAKGRIVTDEMRAAMGRVVIEVTSGEVFPTVRAAADYFGLQRANVVRALRRDAPLKRGPQSGVYFKYAASENARCEAS
jgi:group I intron endonuclease